MLSGKELGTAITVAMERKGVGPTEVARAFGVKPPSVKDWQAFGRLHKKHIPKLLDYFGDVVGPEHWGLSGQSNVELAPIGSRRIPLISYVQAGLWTDAADPYAVGDAADWLMTDLDISSSSFALEIKGDSMLPDFKPGDRVIIDPDIAPQPGDFVVAKNGDHEATFKKYRPRGIGPDGKDVFELVPLNEDYPTIRSDTTPVRIVGTMVEHRKYRRRP